MSAGLAALSLKAHPEPRAEAALLDLLRELKARASAPLHLGIVASVELQQGRVDDALETSRRAFERDHACGVCAEVLADALARKQRFDEAVTIQERVVSLSFGPARRRAEARLAAFEQSAGVAAGADGP